MVLHSPLSPELNAKMGSISGKRCPASGNKTRFGIVFGQRRNVAAVVENLEAVHMLPSSSYHVVYLLVICSGSLGTLSHYLSWCQ